MNHLDLIITLTVTLAAALGCGFVSHLLRLSPIVGYLVAGVAVGANTPGFVANREVAEQLAEVGVILLMFGVGLHFDFGDLLAVRRIAVPGAIAQSLVATLLGAIVGAALGWGWTAGIVYGLAVSVASTAVLVRVLSDNNDLHTRAGHVALGWLIVEDLFTVAVLVLLPALVGNQEAGAGTIALALVTTLAKIALLFAFALIVGGRVIPWLLGWVAATRSRELFTLTILVVALGIAVGSAVLFGVSMALGAFLAGTVVGRSEFSLRAATEALPMRDAFAVLFFVSVGMLFNPSYMQEEPLAILLTLAIVLLGKPAAALAIVLLLRYPANVAVAVAIALGQIGEFSFILADLGGKLDILPDAARNCLVAAAIVSIAINPLLYRLVDPLGRWLMQRPALRRWLTPERSGTAQEEEGTPDERSSAVIVGCGPVGRTLARLLRENEIEPTIIEMNLETVHALREEGRRAVYGDAAHQETLKAAGVGRAATLILSASTTGSAAEVIRLARELNPDIRVLVRTNYLRETAALRRAGADQVFSGEGEVALAMTESVLRRLGATPDQIDRERERLHEDLFGGTDPHGPGYK